MEDYRKAGKIAALAISYGRGLIKPGAPILEVTDKIEKRVAELGGQLAFPVQLSINEAAAHSYPSFNDSRVFQDGDMVKLDIGVHINGHIGDTAITVDLGSDPELVKAAEDALSSAIAFIKPGVTLGEIGKVIEDAMARHGCSPVRNLGGHGLGKYLFHDKPFIPNYDNSDTEKLEAGQVIALEPFATRGAGMVTEGSSAELFAQVGEAQLRVAREVLTSIRERSLLPFSKKDMVRKHGLAKAALALRELERSNSIVSFPPLVEKSKMSVSQFEHTIIVGNPVEILTKE